MHLASRALACGADFRLIGPDRSSLTSSRLDHLGMRGANRLRQRFRSAPHCPAVESGRSSFRSRATPYALRRFERASGTALRYTRRLRPRPVHDRRARGVRAAHQQRRGRVCRRRLWPRSCCGGTRSRRDHLGWRQQRLAILSVRIWKSSCSTRIASATSCFIIRAKPICAAHKFSSSIRWTRRR